MATRHTDGSKALRQFIESNALTQQATAKALGVTDPAVHDWISGTKRPRPHHRAAIEKWTGGLVPASSWLLREEREATRNVVPFRRASDDDAA